MLSGKLPPGLRDLIHLGEGFFGVVGAIAIFCNWKVPEQTAVIAVVLTGYVSLLVLAEAVSAIGVVLMRTLLR